MLKIQNKRVKINIDLAEDVFIMAVVFNFLTIIGVIALCLYAK